jgi:hypothetical protein
VPVLAICKVQLSFTDTVTEIPKYCNVKTGLCQDRPKSLVAKCNPEDISKIVFLKDDLRLANNCSCLRPDDTEDSGEIILLFAGNIVNKY